jgi:hypothetical protein
LVVAFKEHDAIVACFDEESQYMLEGSADPLPSCSAVEALDRQEPFINQTLAASALAMLAQLFRYGRLAHHGAFFNAKTGQMSALPVDPMLWRKLRKPRKASFRPK